MVVREPARWITAETRTMLHRWGTPRPVRPRLAVVVMMPPEALDAAWISSSAPRCGPSGVATSVLEYFEASLDIIQVAANIEGGMVGCSFGSHPAAQRLARRFGIEPIVLRDRFLLSSRVAFDDSRLASRPVTVTTGVTVTDPTPDPTPVSSGPTSTTSVRHDSTIRHGHRTELCWADSVSERRAGTAMSLRSSIRWR